MKKSNQPNNTDVLELDAEEMPLEKVIDNTLIKHNVTDAVIASLKEKYGALRLKDIDDKETYLEIKEARKEVRKVGILTEKLCKKGREDAVAIQKKWLAKEDEILVKIAEVQDPLDNEIKKFDDEVERKEIEAAKKREEIYMNRQTTLSKLGATYNNGNFVLNHISYEVELIKQADNDMWNDTILPKYKKVYEENEAARVEEENKRKAEQEELKKQREEFEAQQKAFKEQQELFQKQQSQLNQQKEEADREQRLEQERKQNEARAKREEVVNKRIDQLISLGMTYSPQYSAYLYKDVNIDVMTELKLWNEQEWDDAIAKITPVIAERKEEEKRIERQRTAGKARFETLKAMGFEHETEVNLSVLSDDDWKNMYEGHKQAFDRKQKEKWEAELKAEKEKVEQKKSEELAQANDKAKWQAFIATINGIVHSEMKSPLYRRKQQMAKEKIEEIINL